MTQAEDWRAKLVALRDEAERLFEFLVDRGWHLRERGLRAENNARYDGWHLVYGGPLVSVRLDYYEMEFVVTLSKGTVDASYLLLDSELFAGASGLAGSMFYVDRLGAVLPRIASDLRANYAAILDGADHPWSRIAELAEARDRAVRARSKELTIECATGRARQQAAVAFTEKRYEEVVRLLGPHMAVLTPIELQKLELSKKRVPAVPVAATTPIPAWRRWFRKE
jgi:hypothetical protein